MKNNPRDGAEMVLIPEGPFQMGGDNAPFNPPHTVTLSGYYIYKNLVTVKQYMAFCDATGRNRPTAPYFDPSWGQRDHPIVNVSWNDAVAYCKWAGVELPSEAQWEKAARGTDGRKYPWGNGFDESKLWCSARTQRSGTCAIGQYPGNLYGLSDMAGNVKQWCSDWWDENYCASSPGPDPTGPLTGTDRVLKGSRWGAAQPGDMLSADRNMRGPVTATGAGFDIGFRCALHVGPVIKTPEVTSVNDKGEKRDAPVARPVKVSPRIVKINPKDGAEMVLITKGGFKMGDADLDYDNPPHTVSLSSYYIYQNLVTVNQYMAFCTATHRAMPRAPSFDPTWSKGDHPIVNVSWNDALAYCSWAGADLPTEAQWEKAARGADGRKFPWGDDFDENRVWSLISCAKLRQEGTCAVGQHSDNPYGLSDMAGNAMQWCLDWYDKEYCKSSPENNPTGPQKGTERVCRGGCWQSQYPGFFRSAFRASMPPGGFAPSQAVNVGSNPPDSIGFRCVVRADTR